MPRQFLKENILNNPVRILNKKNAKNTQVKMDSLDKMDFDPTLINNNCSLIH